MVKTEDDVQQPARCKFLLTHLKAALDVSSVAGALETPHHRSILRL
jgi:hypothetical protein